jgi:Protein of unknown function (DUF2480)
MELKNKVAESGLIVIDPEDFFPAGEFISFDLKDHLFKGLLLKELEFRSSLKNTDWSAYRGKTVAICCSADAILPSWSYMLVMQYLLPVTSEVYSGTPDQVIGSKWLANINSMDVIKYTGERVVIKGCGKRQAGGAVYLELSKKLLPVVKSLMFGEPCSTVPVYKRKEG